MKRRKKLIGAIKLKSIIISIAITFVVLITIILGNLSKSAETRTTPPELGITIILDAGHGGIDPGSIGRTTKITERDINLDITFKLKELLEATNIKVILTRKDENGLYGVYDKNYKIKDMETRRNIIQNASPNLVISIHMNSFSSSKYRGAQVFFDSESKTSEALALSIQKCFAKDLPESDKGISIGDYYILKCTTAPSVLCECGYLSNSEDEQLLTTDEYQNKVAYAIFSGVVAYLNEAS